MLSAAKEIADRFIEFALRFVKGDTVEDQLTKVLKICVLVMTGLLLIIFSLSTSNIDLRVRLSDSRNGVTSFNSLFEPEKSPLSGVVKSNETLIKQMTIIKDQNLYLAKTAIVLANENIFLKKHLITILEENTLIKENNQVLLLKCTAGN